MKEAIQCDSLHRKLLLSLLSPDLLGVAFQVTILESGPETQGTRFFFVMSAYTFLNSTSFPGLFTISLHNLCLVWLIKNQRNLFFAIFSAQYTLYLIGRKRKKYNLKIRSIKQTCTFFHISYWWLMLANDWAKAVTRTVIVKRAGGYER